MYETVNKQKIADNTLIIGDIHLKKKFPGITVNQEDLKEPEKIWEDQTIRYLRESIDRFIEKIGKKRGSVVFLGDTVDNSYIKREELKKLEELFEYLGTIENIEVLVNLGNHDCSSNIVGYQEDQREQLERIGSKKNKYRYSQEFVRTRKMEKTCISFLDGLRGTEVISDIEVRYVDDKTAVILCPYFTRTHLRDKLYSIKHRLAECSRIFLLSHNNIHSYESFMDTPMMSLDELKRVLIKEGQELTVFNGHIHVVHYTPQFFQLGSLSATSFKANPVSSGIISYEFSTKSYQIFNNSHIALLSLRNVDYIPKLVDILESGRSINGTVFFEFPIQLAYDMKPVLSKYSDVIKAVKIVE